METIDFNEVIRDPGTISVVGELSQISGVKGVAISEFVLSSADNYMHWDAPKATNIFSLMLFR